MDGVSPVQAGQPQTLAAGEPTDEDVAEAEAAFAQALGGAVMFMGMNSVNDFKEQMSELEREQEE